MVCASNKEDGTMSLSHVLEGKPGLIFWVRFEKNICESGLGSLLAICPLYNEYDNQKEETSAAQTLRGKTMIIYHDRWLLSV